MGTVWERAAHSVHRMFYLYFDIVISVIPTLVLRAGLCMIASVPGCCLSFTFCKIEKCLNPISIGCLPEFLLQNHG